jgi:quinoprotein dehydrogenase-associated probable ABC transporter substrate-binding protein
MSSACRIEKGFARLAGLAAALLGAALAVGLGWGFAWGWIAVLPEALAAEPTRPPLRICAEPDALPMSQQSTRSGYEIEVAGLLARTMGRELEVKWVPRRDPSFFRMTVGAGACDAIMGIPAGFHRLTLTRPWYRTGFVFVARPESRIRLASFDDPRLRKLRIGVPETGDGETAPALALTRRNLGRNLRPYSILAPRDLVAAVREGKIDLAVIWGPFGGWYGGEAPNRLLISPVPARDRDLPMAYDVAIGVKKGNLALRDELDRAIARQGPAIRKILAKWRVPVLP